MNYLNKLTEEINSIKKDEEKLRFIIDLGTDLNELDPDEFSDKTKVKGCISQTFVKAWVDSNEIKITGNSDSLIVKGLLAIIAESFSEMRRDEFLNKSKKMLDEFLSKTKIELSLTPSRANSFASIYDHIRKDIENSVNK